MADTQHKRLNAAQCQDKAAECRQLSKTALDPSHRVMFEHMAETWERIAKDVSKGVSKANG